MENKLGRLVGWLVAMALIPLLSGWWLGLSGWLQHLDGPLFITNYNIPQTAKISNTRCAICCSLYFSFVRINSCESIYAPWTTVGPLAVKNKVKTGNYQRLVEGICGGFLPLNGPSVDQ
jgi:hypothetical protein